jgi:hypothetical protein
MAMITISVMDMPNMGGPYITGFLERLPRGGVAPDPARP